MIRPSDIQINSFFQIAESNDAICVGVRPKKEFKDGVASDIINGYSYELVLPHKKFEKITLKILGAPLINPELYLADPHYSVDIRDVKDFQAKWYKTSTMSEYALTCSASGFTVLKEGNV